MEETFHTISAGETLYRLTITYNVSAKTITDANPGLSAENFKVGQVIRIPIVQDDLLTEPKTKEIVEEETVPRCKDMHKVKRKETIFSISREYGLTENELITANPEIKKGLKKGAWLCIPYPSSQQVPDEDSPFVVDVQQTPPSNNELFNLNKETLYIKY